PLPGSRWRAEVGPDVPRFAVTGATDMAGPSVRVGDGAASLPVLHRRGDARDARTGPRGRGLQAPAGQGPGVAGRHATGPPVRDRTMGGPDALACGVSRVRRTLPGACGELRHDYGLHVDSLRSIQEPMRWSAHWG